VMVPVVARFQYLSFLVPALVILAAVALSFVPSWMPNPSAEPHTAT